MGPVGSVLLVLLFIVVGGTFAAAEIALVSLREGQVKALGERGRRGRRVSALARDPNRFLAAVQIGVTLAGFLSAAFGAATLADDLSPALEDLGLSDGVAHNVALVVVTLLISYASLVLGELAPKRLALQRAERVALATAPALDRIATLSRPVIWLLSKSANGVVRIFGGDPHAGGAAISEEELRGLVAAHEALDADERRLIDDVFAAGERQVREVMVPRTEVAFLDAALTVARAVKEAQVQPHSRYPVVRGSSDDIVGFVHVRDLMGASARRGVRLGELAREVKMLPATKPVLGALSEMRREGQHMAVVVDEYGGTAGIVTLEDLIEEVIGDIRDEYDVESSESRTLRGGDLDVDALLNIEDFTEQTGVEIPDGPYETVAGFFVRILGRLPRVGDAIEAPGARLKVTELDGRRIARLRVTRLETEEGDERDSS